MYRDARLTKYKIFIAVSIVNTHSIQRRCWTYLLSTYRHTSHL